MCSKIDSEKILETLTIKKDYTICYHCGAKYRGNVRICGKCGSTTDFVLFALSSPSMPEGMRVCGRLSRADFHELIQFMNAEQQK